MTPAYTIVSVCISSCSIDKKLHIAVLNRKKIIKKKNINKNKNKNASRIGVFGCSSSLFCFHLKKMNIHL